VSSQNGALGYIWFWLVKVLEKFWGSLWI